jgi:NADPH:quinone reductase-like Zn-dependent oxidoreductase
MEVMMKAVRAPEYGPADRLRLLEIAKPVLEPDQILVRIRAASVNPFDWHLMRGDPYVVRLFLGLRRPKDGGRLGVDAAGVVEAVGAAVNEFRPGDEVFGSVDGAFAEYAMRYERHFVHKPANLGVEESAALPAAGVTALQAVRDHGAVAPGHRVLVNGASGGVGTFGVQIAKAHGAYVTGVCSTRNVDLVRSLGADVVLDYTKTDFLQAGPYDVILDNVGNRPLHKLARGLKPGGTLVAVAGGKGGRLLGGMSRKFWAPRLNRLVKPRILTFTARVTKADMLALKQLVESGKVKPVIDRRYRLDEAPDAIRYVESGHARAKVLIVI